MSAPPTSSPPLDLVAVLRGAGCVFAEDEARLLLSSAATPTELAAMVERRVSGVPLEHVVGWAAFCGLRIAVDPGVFVPRPRTEFLVEQAVALAAAAWAPVGSPDRPPIVVDLCCGTGAVGAALVAALAPELGAVELHATDIDPAAVRCARRNVAATGQVYEGDLYAALPSSLRGRVDLVVANAPYVPTEAVALLPAEARVHEPLVSLDGGSDGLDVLRRVVSEAPAWLAPGGHLLVETSEHQSPGLAATLVSSGLIPRIASSGELFATVVIGTRPLRA